MCTKYQAQWCSQPFEERRRPSLLWTFLPVPSSETRLAGAGQGLGLGGGWRSHTDRSLTPAVAASPLPTASHRAGHPTPPRPGEQGAGFSPFDREENRGSNTHSIPSPLLRAYLSRATLSLTQTHPFPPPGMCTPHSFPPSCSARKRDGARDGVSKAAATPGAWGNLRGERRRRGRGGMPGRVPT